MEMTTTRWDVALFLSELEGTTHAEARLRSGLAEPLSATGAARLSLDDRVDVAEIGCELAAARALRQLSERLLRTAELDIDAFARP